MNERADSPDQGAAPAPPPGFVRHGRRSPLTEPWEPIYEGRDGAGRLVLGVGLRSAHANSRGMAHGGLLAALADKAMGVNCGEAVRALGVETPGLVTVSLGLDYLESGRIGQWLTVETGFVRAGRTLCFAGGEALADGRLIARAHATFRVLAPG